MEVNAQVHVPAALSPGKRVGTHRSPVWWLSRTGKLITPARICIVQPAALSLHRLSYRGSKPLSTAPRFSVVCFVCHPTCPMTKKKPSPNTTSLANQRYINHKVCTKMKHHKNLAIPNCHKIRDMLSSAAQPPDSSSTA